MALGILFPVVAAVVVKMPPRYTAKEFAAALRKKRSAKVKVAAVVDEATQNTCKDEASATESK